MGVNSLGAISLLKPTEERVSSLQGRGIGVVQGPASLLEIFSKVTTRMWHFGVWLANFRVIIYLREARNSSNTQVYSASSQSSLATLTLWTSLRASR